MNIIRDVARQYEVAEIVKTRKGSGKLALDETTHLLFFPLR
jgi:hypothetical protein